MQSERAAVFHGSAEVAPAPQAVPAFDIVPLRGLPLVAAALLFLVVAVTANWGWAINFLHVSAGGLWTGIDLFVGLVIGPILARLPPQARIEFSVRFMPKMVLLMPTLVIITLTSGWQLANYFGYLRLPYPLHWWLTASFIVVGVMSVVAAGYWSRRTWRSCSNSGSRARTSN